MRTTMHAFSTSCQPLFTVGDVVHIAKIGLCKVIEASKTAFTVMDSAKVLYEVNEVLNPPSRARKSKAELNRGVF